MFRDNAVLVSPRFGSGGSRARSGFWYGMFVSVLLVAAISFFSSVAAPSGAHAQVALLELQGLAWSSNIGWINFNCEETLSCGQSDYRVYMDSETGLLSGFAWSSNIGWISFNELDIQGCPNGACEAKVVGNELTGWARALSGETSGADGFDGWIHFKGPSYGVTFSGQAFGGFAWGGDVIGWIDFSPSKGPGVSVNGQTVLETGVLVGGGTSDVNIIGDSCDTEICLFQYPEGTELSLVANPGGGLAFERWVGRDAGRCSDPNSRVCPSIILDTNLEIKARFTGVNCPEQGPEGVCPQCNDGIDNDGDGQTDFPGDNACHSAADSSEEEGPACDDCIDNDGDGLYDFTPPAVGLSSDTGCYYYDDLNEADAVLNVVIESDEGGTGVVTSDIGGIACEGVSCTATFIRDEEVTLTATPEPGTGSVFWRWVDPTGACVGTGSTCRATMDRSRTITARFGKAAPPDGVELRVIIEERNGATGRVVGSSMGIDCWGSAQTAADCNVEMFHAEAISLNAVPGENSQFVGWTVNISDFARGETFPTLELAAGAILAAGGGSGVEGCSGDASGCEMTMPEHDMEVTAAFEPEEVVDPKSLSVTVQLDGDAEGSVTSNDGLISCEADCYEEYLAEETVTLTANPGPRSLFWTWVDPLGVCTDDTPTCVVTMDQNRVITARFGDDPAFGPKDLEVFVVRDEPNADGRVRSLDPHGGDILCIGPGAGSDCNETYDHGTEVTLKAEANAGSVFWRWSDPNGTCVGNNQECTVTMDISQEITAHFGEGPGPTGELLTLSISKEGGDGRAFTDIGQIDCEPKCQERYFENELVSIIAEADTDSIFAGWIDPAGACGGVDPICTVLMNVTRHITARFRAAGDDTSLLTVAIDEEVGSDGQVVSNDGFIECDDSADPSCQHDYGLSETVVLQAIPNDAGTEFWFWEDVSGQCVPDNSTCVLTMEVPRSVVAHFGTGARPDPETLRVTVVARDATSDGTVIAAGGINCDKLGGSCEADYFANDVVPLVANPDLGSKFVSWSGDIGACAPADSICEVTMDQTRNVTATFALADAGAVCPEDGPGVCPQCNDGIDNEDPEDELVDFPNDPGCWHPGDDDETDPVPIGNCPEDGPDACPECNDGIDNDGDGTIDWAGITPPEGEGEPVERDISCRGEPNRDREEGIVIIEI